MGFVNLAEKTISAKLVYYGVGLGGKTTSLKVVHGLLCPRDEVKLVSINTEQDATLLFDFLPIDLGQVEGFKIRVQGFTVPGQDKYVQMRRYVLQGADAVVLVIDSQRSRVEENLRSIEDLRRNLQANGIDFDQLPLVVQYNKRDLDDLVPDQELDQLFNPRSAPSFSSIATQGEGVLEAFLESVGLMVEQKVRQYGLGRGQVEPREVADEAKERILAITDELADGARRAGRDPDSDPGGLLQLNVRPTEEEQRESLQRESAEREPLASGEEPLTDFDVDAELPGLEELEGDLDAAKALEVFDELDFVDDEGTAEAIDELEEDLGTELSSEAEAPPAAEPRKPAAPAASNETQTDPELSEEILETVTEETNGLLGQVINSNMEMAELYAELAEYKGLLERKNRELVEVIQVITHDLKRPLTVFKTVVGLLGKGHLGPLNERQGEAIHNASESVGYMEELLHDILDASRLDYDGVQLEFEEVDMTALVGDILRKLKFHLDESGVRVRVEPLPSILCDGGSLTKVLMNLIGNAVNYRNPEQERPWIRVEVEDQDDDWIFRVADNGLGIPEDNLATIWQKFERGTNTRQVTGTGLGLYIVKQIVLAHGGEIGVESELGVGTTFTMRLPKEPKLAEHSPAL
jgi:signal transduction histidine kinase/signal recognition particle receptor subunit beta